MQKNSSVKWLGFWSAILVATSTLLFIGFYGAYEMRQPATWQGIDTYIKNFSQGLYLGWVIPCLVLALTFPLLSLCICFITEKKKLIWACAGLLFAVIYGAVLSANYFELATTVRSAILQRHTESLEWFIIGSPYSITGALEGVGYGFMSLSFLFTGFAFGGTRIFRVLRWLLIINGICGLLGVLFTVFSIAVISIVSLGIWSITFPTALILMAIIFLKSDQNKDDLHWFAGASEQIFP